MDLVYKRVVENSLRNSAPPLRKVDDSKNEIEVVGKERMVYRTPHVLDEDLAISMISKFNRQGYSGISLGEGTYGRVMKYSVRQGDVEFSLAEKTPKMGGDQRMNLSTRLAQHREKLVYKFLEKSAGRKRCMVPKYRGCRYVGEELFYIDTIEPLNKSKGSIWIPLNLWHALMNLYYTGITYHGDLHIGNVVVSNEVLPGNAVSQGTGQGIWILDFSRSIVSIEKTGIQSIVWDFYAWVLAGASIFVAKLSDPVQAMVDGLTTGKFRPIEEIPTIHYAYAGIARQMTKILGFDRNSLMNALSPIDMRSSGFSLSHLAFNIYTGDFFKDINPKLIDTWITDNVSLVDQVDTMMTELYFPRS